MELYTFKELSYKYIVAHLLTLGNILNRLSTINVAKKISIDDLGKNMERYSSEEVIEEISTVIGNKFLAMDIFKATEAALENPIFICGAKNEWGVFQRSLDTAIRDIQSHPRGKLFQRLIEYGPYGSEIIETGPGDKETVLSDSECGDSVEFIFSHMVNRFKGELAELLAIEPCIALVQELINKQKLPENTRVYWGEMVQERREVFNRVEGKSWGGFAKGADGLIVQMPDGKIESKTKIQGIVEIKSMQLSVRKILKQIEHHLYRLSGGLKLGEREFTNYEIFFNKPDNIKILVVPASWKLSRQVSYIENPDGSKTQVSPDNLSPPIDTHITEILTNVWIITLAWSQEALNQAAYEMTFWYMSQVGKHVFTENEIPKDWENMASDEAGYNSIKMMLYYVLLRPLSSRQMRLATRLYNVYSFGYPLGVDSKEMLWPEDL